MAAFTAWFRARLIIDGLRDYGTASWTGGRGDCLHLNVASSRFTYGQQKRKWQHANNGQELAKALGMDAPGAKPVTDAHRLHLTAPAGGALCLDCGAVRMEPTVWGGDPDCEHEWGEVYQPTANAMDHPMAGSTLNPHSATRKPKLSASCLRCGAWRGALGLEPLHDCLGWATGAPCGGCYVCHILQAMREVRRTTASAG